jgi:hypothetical protein
MKSLICTLVAVSLIGSIPAMAVTYNDATGEIDPGIANAGGSLDIVSMEVVNTLSDITFTLTLNGNVNTPNDWGNFMIGIANQNAAGTTVGNAWNRPINLDAGGGNGMTHWIGSWVNAGGGSQLWDYTGTWNGPVALAGFTITPGVQTTIAYNMTLASLGISVGDTIRFDAYSTGGGGTDSAVDALSNPNVSITSWGQTYTSDGTTGLNSYTVVPEPSSVALFGLGSLLMARFIRRRK